MTDTAKEPLADIIARLQVAVRPHAASPVTARRLPTDSPPPNGLVEGYGTRRNTMANTRNGGGSCHYRPRADYFAGGMPATTRPDASASVKPAGNRKIAGPAMMRKNGRRVPSVALLTAKATGQNEAMRQQATVRHNLSLTSGEIPPAGLSYRA